MNVIQAPPQAEDIEQVVLGCMLSKEKLLHECMEKLKVEYFYNPRHKKIFRAIDTLYRKGVTLDFNLVAMELEAVGQLAQIGNRQYLMDIMDGFITDIGLDGHIDLIRNNALKRKLIEVNEASLRKCYDKESNIVELLDSNQSKIFEIATESTNERSNIIRACDITDEMFEKIEKGRCVGVPTGFYKFDSNLLGLQKGYFILLAARPSVGKTALAMNIAEHMAHKGHPCLFVSLEMSVEQLMLRLYSSGESLPFSAKDLKKGIPKGDKRWDSLAKRMAYCNQLPLYIVDAPGNSITTIKALTKRAKIQYGIECVIVDYIQIVTTGGGFANRNMEMTYISSTLKNIARDLDVPVLALSQFSRIGDKLPTLESLRDSGSLEQDADQVLLMHRLPCSDNDEFKQVDVYCAKARNESTFITEMMFHGKNTRFYPKDDDRSFK